MSTLATLSSNPAHHVEESGPADLPLAIVGEASFDQAFRDFYPGLLRYATRITGSERTAQDVVQDVFLKLWGDRDSTTVTVSLQALLYTMTRNRALNSIRNRARQVGEGAEVVLENRAASNANQIDLLQADALKIRMAKWINELPERRREAFVLSRTYRLSHAEIAAIMGVGLRTIDTHILLALRELRTRVEAFQKDD